MPKIRNRSTVPQGMLAPAGYGDTVVNPNVQATTRPAGSLLTPSPGYASIRGGKNQFQGRGPMGGFREMEFAEDVGGTGAAFSVIPGDTTAIEASEWIPESEDSIPEGSMIIADRGSAQEPGFARELHEAYNTIPDMGDRNPNRPLSKSAWLKNPIGMFRADLREDPAHTIFATVLLVTLAKILGDDLHRSYNQYRGRGVATEVTAAPAAVAETGGTTAAEAVNDVGEAADNAIQRIEDATNKAVNTLNDAADNAKNTVTGE